MPNCYANGLPMVKAPDSLAAVGDLIFWLTEFADFHKKHEVAVVEEIDPNERCSYQGTGSYPVAWARVVSPAAREHQFCFYLDPNVAKNWRHLTSEEMIRYADKT